MSDSENTEDSWWKGFFTLLVFMTLIIIIISSAIYGIFFSSEDEKEETVSESISFISRIFSYFSGDSSDDKKSEEKQSVSDDESQKLIEVEEVEKEVEKELEMYWSESNQKILQLEQKITNIKEIVTKHFPPVQPTEYKEILSVPVPTLDIDTVSIDKLDFSSEFNNLDSTIYTDFEPTWKDVGNHLIKLEEEQSKSFAKLSE